MTRFIDQLIGGEKTMEIPGLLFAIQSFKLGPFFVLDDDAALNKINLNKLEQFIQKNPSQFIIISLKNSLYEQMGALFGVYKQESSNVLTLML